jgi:hypothetical protein
MANRSNTKLGDTPRPSIDVPIGLSIKEYEQSKEWKAKSKSFLDDKDCECAICHRKRWKKYKKKAGWKRMLRFSIHHLTYKNVPNEKPDDLLTVCWFCHSICHDILRMQHIHPFYKALAKVVYKFGFKYDKYEEGE